MKLKLDFKTISSADNIWDVTICDKYNKDCIWRKCNNYSAEKVFLLFPFIVKSKIIELFQWENVLVERDNKPPIRVIR